MAKIRRISIRLFILFILVGPLLFYHYRDLFPEPIPDYVSEVGIAYIPSIQAMIKDVMFLVSIVVFCAPFFFSKKWVEDYSPLDENKQPTLLRVLIWTYLKDKEVRFVMTALLVSIFNICFIAQFQVYKRHREIAKMALNEYRAASKLIELKGINEWQTYQWVGQRIIETETTNFDIATNLFDKAFNSDPVASHYSKSRFGPSRALAALRAETTGENPTQQSNAAAFNRFEAYMNDWVRDIKRGRELQLPGDEYNSTNALGIAIEIIKKIQRVAPSDAQRIFELKIKEVEELRKRPTTP